MCTFFRMLLAALSVIFFFPAAHAFARPEMAKNNAQERFAHIDENKDNKISKEEFFTALPQTREAAFTTIDTDKSGDISPEEWEAFLTGHAMGKQGGMMPPRDPHMEGAPMMGATPMKKPTNGTVPKKHDLLMPERQKKNS